MRSAFIGVATGLTVLAQGVEAQQIRCDIERKYVCETSGCRTAPIDMWNIIDTAQQTYSRCDKQGCDTHSVLISRSGKFLNFELQGRGTTAKMAVDGSSFHEVATLVHNVFISFGKCAELN